MMDTVLTMLNQIHEVLISHNAAEAVNIAALDDIIDDKESSVIDAMLESMHDNPDSIMENTGLIWISHHIERIGDHITNIAERVNYIVTGKSVELNH